RDRRRAGRVRTSRHERDALRRPARARDPRARARSRLRPLRDRRAVGPGHRRDVRSPARDRSFAPPPREEGVHRSVREDLAQPREGWRAHAERTRLAVTDPRRLTDDPNVRASIREAIAGERNAKNLLDLDTGWKKLHTAAASMTADAAVA